MWDRREAAFCCKGAALRPCSAAMPPQLPSHTSASAAPFPRADVEAAVRQVLPIAVAMLPINAAVYVFDGIITGASDFKFMAGEGPDLFSVACRVLPATHAGLQQHQGQPNPNLALLRRAGAMVLAAGTAAGLLLGVEPLGLGLPGVWYAMGLLMVSRLGTMMWRYQSESGPLPPSGVRGGPGGQGAAACLEALSSVSRADAGLIEAPACSVSCADGGPAEAGTGGVPELPCYPRLRFRNCPYVVGLTYA